MRSTLAQLGIGAVGPVGPTLFVCTLNSARSQLAAALWTQMTGTPGTSAGTHPAAEVHPAAVAAGARAGLDLSDAIPRTLDDATSPAPPSVVTVCDRAHEELDDHPSWWHWSVPDPVAVGTEAAFDDVVAELTQRISTVFRPDHAA